MKKLRVAVVYQYFAHYRGPIIQAMSRDSDIEYDFVAGDVKNPINQSIKLYDFSELTTFRRVTNVWICKYFLFQRNLLVVLLSGKYDAVVFLGDWKYLSTWLSSRVLSVKGIRTYFWGHGMMREGNFVLDKIKLLFYCGFSNGGFVYSERAKDFMLSIGYTGKIVTVYNSLNYDVQLKAMERFDGEPHGVNDGGIIVYSGRLERLKKIDLLIQAISYLKHIGVKMNVVLIGDGSHRLELQREVEGLGLEDQFDFVGSCYDENVIGKYYLSSLVSVIPSAVGLSAIHSMTYGVPVITSNRLEIHGPEVDAVVDGETGLFYEDGSVQSLAETLLRIRSMSRAERQKISANCQKIVAKNYTPETQRLIFSCELLQNVAR